MTTIPECPCGPCVTNAICRHKLYGEVVQCPIVCKFIENYTLNTYGLCRIAICNALNPTMWKVGDNGEFIEYQLNDYKWSF